MPYVGTLYYESHGAGRPLVLLHGNTLDRRMWEAHVRMLSHRFHIITPDLRGHGQSGAVTEGPALADDVARLLEHLEIKQAAICGLSLGGAVAVSFALHYPTRCAALIPVDPFLFGYRPTEWKGARPYITLAREAGLGPALEAWLGDPLFASALASPAAAWVQEIVRSFSGDAWLAPSGLICAAGRPEAERLSEIAAPTLVIVGEHDLPDFQAIARQMAGQIPGARLAVIPGAGHLSVLEQPLAFCALLQEFLDQLWGKQPS